MAHTIYAKIPTPWEKREQARQAEEARKRKADRQAIRSRNGRAYSELTPAEKRKVDNILQKSNAQIRQRLGIYPDLSYAEFR